MLPETSPDGSQIVWYNSSYWAVLSIHHIISYHNVWYLFNAFCFLIPVVYCSLPYQHSHCQFTANLLFYWISISYILPRIVYVIHFHVCHVLEAAAVYSNGRSIFALATSLALDISTISVKEISPKFVYCFK